MQRKELTTGIFLTFFFLLMLSFFSINKLGLTGYAISNEASTGISFGFIVSLIGLVGVIYYFFFRRR
jgi:hypothetical protein